MNSYDQVEWLRSNKGGAKIIHKGYMYTIHKKRYGRIRWRCAQRTLHCKGSVTTGSGAPIINLPHNHVPDLHAVVQARCRTSQISDENECLGADIIPLLPNSIYSFPEDQLHANYDQSAEQNTDTELNDSFMDELNHQPESKSILKPLAKASQSTLSNQSNTSNSESEMCLRWNSHHANMQTIFPNLLQNERYVDVTLAAEGQLMKCHKLVLSSCSEYFDEILKDAHPMQHTVIYLRGIPFWVVQALVDFMYKGEVNIDQIRLEALLKAAEDLQIKGLAGKGKIKKEPDIPIPPVPVPVPEQKQTNEFIEKEIKKEVDKNFTEMDDNDVEYHPSQQYKKKVQPKKIRKRKIATPPDPSLLKHVKINLKGTKSRPNIKQPKYYDPDYPEYDPDRCVSPPKLDSTDPIFNIDNIKMEPIDFEVPTSPSYSEISSLMDQSLSECASLEKLKSDKIKPSFNVKRSEEPKKIRKYAGKTGISMKSKFTADKQLVFQKACENIDVPSSVSVPASAPAPASASAFLTKETSDKEKSPKIESIIANKPTSVATDLAFNKSTIILNVQNKNTDATSLKQIIDEKPAFAQIRVRNLTTTDNVLKKFATTQLTSILKRESSTPAILRRVASPKPAILRHSTPKKIDVVKAENSEIAEKLSTLAKTKKELTSAELMAKSPNEVKIEEHLEAEAAVSSKITEICTNPNLTDDTIEKD